MESNERAGGMVFNIQRFSLHDGPGIRTNIFLKGCPLSCVWCHNPEGGKARAELSYFEQKCVRCEICNAVCGRGVHSFDAGAHLIDREKCVLCGTCADKCSYGALDIVGRYYSANEALNVAARDKVFYGDEGGITLTGGEPMAQPEFTLALAQGAVSMGMRVCVETSGYCAERHLLAIAPYVQQFLYDIKETDPQKHIEYTGVSNRLILSNLSALDNAGAEIVLRCPLIPGLNARQAHIEGIARLANSLKHIKGIDIEPYHTLGVDKRARFGIHGGFDLRRAMPREEAEAFADILRQNTDVRVRVS